ncbi:unnamed protein product [Symbiodinium sp. CCMP2456]|nr:unnamed protein product [Symbiodinium sp. CCMP2456]
MLWEDTGELVGKRPEELRSAIAAKFAEQETAGGGPASRRRVAPRGQRKNGSLRTSRGREKKYGASGSSMVLATSITFTKDYELSGFVWDCAENITKRERIFGLRDLVETLAPVDKRDCFTVLDLGCGDGQSLFALHSHFGLSWENIVGVTAEDSRGVEVLTGTEPFDLRSAAGADSEASYVVWNIDDLVSCPCLRGRTFDLIVSWVTWIWLADPVGTLEMIYENFLRSGGVMMLGGVQLLTPGPDPMEDQRWLFALSDFLIEEGHQIKCFADASSGAYTWWIQRKRQRPHGMHRSTGLQKHATEHQAMSPGIEPACELLRRHFSARAFSQSAL